MTSVESERIKYEKIWRVPDYRCYSPGEHLVKHFLNSVPWEKGDTLIDLGCGTGRAGKALANEGLHVFLLDLVKDAVDPDIILPFISANLWNLPRALKFDWIYSTDVLEHIPPCYVDATLDGMVEMTRKGGMLQIAHFQDGFGKVIGETLHLTVEPPEWWRKKITERWPVLRWETDQSRSIAFLGTPKENL
jgi:2-polyprenyl-3-methyl-5-hydroxy-6-metoxy-1,4-benzoquinol methylase